MANYNSGQFYNKKVPDGGAIYNSRFYIIIDATGTDAIENITATVNVLDNTTGVDAINNILASINVSDNVAGIDKVDEIVKIVFYIDQEGYLHPFGLLVMRDSRYEFLPAIRPDTDEIPGRHGKIYFGSRLGSRLLELHVASEEWLTPEQKEELKRKVANYLNPTSGPKDLIFADEPEKLYQVKYSGKIDITQYADWLEFTIPFKTANPYILGITQKSLSGSGIITNSGNTETPLIIEIYGEITNPVITIGSYVLSYSGTIPAGQTLIVDTEKKTVTLNGENVLYNWSGGFPKLQPGDNLVSADSKVTFKWRDRWL